MLDLRPFDNSDRVRVSALACSMSLEHWDATRLLLMSELLPSALVVHRSQFEALVRSIWILYAATDESISKLAVELTLESEQAAKNLPSVLVMMEAIRAKAPPQAHDVLVRFKDNSWKALNSYAHAGIHPLRRHEQGYPISLITNVFKNTNGLAMVSGMQAVVLAGQQPMQKQILQLASQYPNCLPEPL